MSLTTNSEIIKSSNEPNLWIGYISDLVDGNRDMEIRIGSGKLKGKINLSFQINFVDIFTLESVYVLTSASNPTPIHPG